VADETPLSDSKTSSIPQKQPPASTIVVGCGFVCALAGRVLVRRRPVKTARAQPRIRVFIILITIHQARPMHR